LIDARWALDKIDAIENPVGGKPHLTEEEAIGKYGRGD